MSWWLVGFLILVLIAGACVYVYLDLKEFADSFKTDDE
jgi:hypothetical protein